MNIKQKGGKMEYVVEGVLSAKAVIEAKRRKVNKVWINQKKRSRDLDYLIKIAKMANIVVKFVEEADIQKHVEGKTHGGVIAFVEDRKYQSVSDILKVKKPFIAVLEGIEDPFNFGYCLRSLYAAGCNGVIVPARNWTSVVDVVTKSSAGASEFINIVESEDLSETILQLKAAGLTIYGANRKDATSIYNTEFADNLVIAIGGEKRGLSKKVAELCDYNVYIPYANDFKNAINGSSATAIFGFEIFRQRGI